MKILDILQGLDYVVSNKALLNKKVKDVKIDNRLVEKGDLFIALKGKNKDGNEFIDNAISAGAICVVTDKNIHGENIINVKNARNAYSIISKNFFGRACDFLKIIAITGTNGKTTTSHIVSSILTQIGFKVGIIGTLGAKYNGIVEDTGFTTPDPYLLHNIFMKMKKSGIEYVVMEASAHALALNKLDGINFEVGLLTNITEDHLDFFGNMSNYAEAKLKLFDLSKKGIYFNDDLLARTLLSDNSNLLTYGFARESDFLGKIEEMTIEGSKFTYLNNGNTFNVFLPLIGEFNVENALASISICKALGLDDNVIISALKEVEPIKGRINFIDAGKSKVVVDFAHTPDGIEKILTALRDVTSDKLVIVFGCGGRRERHKRYLMGQIASKYADEIVLTNDNPRDENPYTIIADIKKGISGKCKVITDRKSAIEYCLKKYNHGEVICVAGKGGEKYQEVKGIKLPYDDFQVIDNFIKKSLK